MSTLPAPPRRHPGQVRHSAKTMALARSLYGDGDAWTPTQIRRLMEQRGIDPLPHIRTIRNWVIPGDADRWRTSCRQRAEAATPQTATDPVARLARLRVLRAAGMSYSGLAVLANVDFGLDLDDDQVRRALQARRLTPTIRRHLGNIEGSTA